jgi:type I restriction enzyme S subunit
MLHTSHRANTRGPFESRLAEANDLISTTALPSLSASVLGSIEISPPPMVEQSVIATVFSDMHAEIAALEAHRDKTRDIKQGITRRLLTGRVRVVKAAAEAAA